MLKKCLFASLYFFSSLFAILLNKYLIENHKNSPFTILTIQTILISLFSLPFCAKYNLKRNILNIFICAIFLFLMISTNIFALKIFSLPDFIILKSLSLFIEFKKYFILAYIFLLLSLCSKSFLQYTIGNYLVIGCNIFFHYFYLLFFKKLTKKNMNIFSAIFSVQMCLLLPLITLSICFNEQLQISIGDIVNLFLTSSSIFLLNINTVFTLRIFSPLILNILGCLNKFTIFAIHSKPEVNLFMNIFGSVCYIAISFAI